MWKRLHELSDRTIDVTLQWVPGHAGLDGNETADRLAGEATDESQANVPVDLASARGAIRRHIAELVQARAETAHPHPDLTPDHDDLPRWEAVTVSQLRTGFSPLTRDTLHRIGLASDDLCPACKASDSAEHLLAECPAYSAVRSRLQWGQDPTLKEVLSRPAPQIVGFLRRVGRVDPPVDVPPRQAP